jgi:hypothetical protein
MEKSDTVNTMVNITSDAPVGAVDDQVTKPSEKGILATELPTDSSDSDVAPDAAPPSQPGPVAPWTWKLAAVLLISCISFGSSWSSGISGAMKSTLKKQLHIDNTQFALLEASEDFMVTVLILASGFVTVCAR